MFRFYCMLTACQLKMGLEITIEFLTNIGLILNVEERAHY